jgi:hypothetical protein
MTGILRRTAVMAVLLITAAAVHAADCVTKTELIATRGFHPNRVAGPIAWNSFALAVTKTETGAAKAIYVGMYTDGLFRFDPVNHLPVDVRIAESSLDGPISVFWTGNEFGVFYQSPDRRIRLQLVSGNGEPIGGSAIITPNHGVFPEDEFEVTWDPTRQAYAMIRTITQGGDKGMWLILLERDGRTRADRRVELFPGKPAQPRIAVTSRGVIGMFYTHAITGSYTMLPIGKDDALQPSVPVASTAGRAVDVATLNNLFGIVRRTDLPANRTEIRWLVLDEAGAVVTGDRQLAVSRGADVSPIALGGHDQEWALSYADSPLGFDLDRGEMRLLRFTTSGGQISNTLFTNDFSRTFVIGSDPFVWTGASYVTSAELFVNPNEGSDSYLISHCPIQASVTSSLPVVRLYQPVTFTPTIQGGTGPFRYDWDFGDRSSGLGAPVSHTYQHTGTYTAVLTVTDAAGGKSITAITVRVTLPKSRAVRH